ncbi:MAG: type I-F CRISPR-associated endoribonuclease Cas6/Csy4 [Gammaproteobacteria bacterium]|nr:MAG: type I-F CRISPR-associated endoribonuclease Cas6/Csy4 [Gammaproteobacteria bacterium]
MNYYIDVKIQPDAEMRENFLLNKVFSKLHKAIFDLKAMDIGVSFPQAKNKLGCVIRLHSKKQNLENLQKLNWLGGLVGYCELSQILPVPDEIKGYKVLSRVRQNMTNAKLRRLIKRGKISDDEVKGYKAKMFAGGLDEPYLELRSASTGKLYRLYIKIGKLQNEPVAGEFNNFGLSKTATMPIF